VARLTDQRAGAGGLSISPRNDVLGNLALILRTRRPPLAEPRRPERKKKTSVRRGGTDLRISENPSQCHSSARWNPSFSSRSPSLACTDFQTCSQAPPPDCLLCVGRGIASPAWGARHHTNDICRSVPPRRTAILYSPIFVGQ